MTQPVNRPQDATWQLVEEQCAYYVSVPKIAHDHLPFLTCNVCSYFRNTDGALGFSDASKRQTSAGCGAENIMPYHPTEHAAKRQVSSGRDVLGACFRTCWMMLGSLKRPRDAMRTTSFHTMPQKKVTQKVSCVVLPATKVPLLERSGPKVSVFRRFQKHSAGKGLNGAECSCR